MSSGVNRIIASNLTPRKAAKSALVSALGSAFTPSKIAATTVKSLNK